MTIVSIEPKSAGVAVDEAPMSRPRLSSELFVIPVEEQRYLI